MNITPDTIEFDNISDLSIFVRYDAKNPKSVPNGYVLAEDMLNNKGGVLYAKNTGIDASHIGRLIRIIENNPEVKPKFVLKLNDIVVKIEQAKNLAGIKQLIDSKASRKVYARLMASVKKIVEVQFHDIFNSPDIVLYISKLKFLEDKTKKSKISPFYNHMLNTLIFSMGIISHLQEDGNANFDTDDIGNIGILAMLHAVSGWETSSEFIEMELETREKNYIEANEKNYEKLKNDKSISGDFHDESILDAIKLCYEFQKGNVDFITGESKATLYANIVCVASAFNQEIAGLWKSSRTAREVVDSMYVLVQSQKLPNSYVDALAKSLQFSDLFDFYKELDSLNNSCKRSASKAYPMTGFKSPVIYVCSQNLHECKEYVASAKAISVFKEIGGLGEGQYGRCEGLSDRLVQFYDEHYKDIKEEVMAKQLGLGKKDEEEEENKPASKPVDPAHSSADTERNPESGSKEQK